VTDDERVAQWCRWLAGIRGEVEYMLHSRMMYTKFWGIIEANPRIKGPNAFYAWLNTMYAGYTAVAVRRQLDMDSRTVSMARLLTDVSGHPAALSRERYLGLFPAHLRKMADEQFARFAVPGGVHIDPGVPCGDLEQLRRSAEGLRRFVNKKIAHSDLDGERASATYGQLNRCLDLLEKLVTKYHNLLTAETYITLVPTILSPWKRIFRQPWIAPTEPNVRLGQGSDPKMGMRDEHDG